MGDKKQRGRQELLLFLQALGDPDEEQVEKMVEPFSMIQHAHGHLQQTILMKWTMDCVQKWTSSS